MNWRASLVSTAPDKEIAEKIAATIDKLFVEDAILFEVDANERSISHRFGVHLLGHFEGWDIDCEYNRDGHEPKTLQLEGNSVDAADTDGSRVFPDVIVHLRDKPENLLVIEMKKSTSGVPDAVDLKKLRAYRQQLHYTHALFLRFQCGKGSPGLVEAKWC